MSLVARGRGGGTDAPSRGGEAREERETVGAGSEWIRGRVGGWGECRPGG